MIQKATFTGNLKDEYVEVEMSFGVTRYVLPVYQFPMIGVITAEWITKFGKLYWALIEFEQDNLEKPLLIGVSPMTGKNFPPEGLDNKYYFYTTKFRIFVDDDADNYAIESLSGEGIINLGSTNAAQHAVLGDTLLDKFDQLIDVLKTGVINTEIGPQKFMPPTQTALTNIKNDLSDILSGQVKLD